MQINDRAIEICRSCGEQHPIAEMIYLEKEDIYFCSHDCAKKMGFVCSRCNEVVDECFC